MSARFDIGAFGWDHAAWQQSFYPDDLPADWRLTYYANEIPLVLVPEEAWLGGSASAWVEDVHDRFAFYLQMQGSRLAEADYADALRQAAETLDGHLAGLVDFDPIGESAPVSIEAPLLRAVNAGDDGWQEGGGLVPAFILQQSALGSLRDQRGLLESLAEQARDCAEVPLFLAGDPPEVDSLRGLRQLATLMGLA